MLKEITEMLHLQKLEELTVLEHPWCAWQVDVSHFIVLDQGDKEPEGHFLCAVLEKGTYDEIHALNITD